jgi:rhodanese-related sulfurtransferase
MIQFQLIRCSLIALLLALISSCKTVSRIAEATPGSMPTFESASLNDEVVRFPGALNKRCHVLVLSFDDPQQPAAKEWFSKLNETKADREIWSMPVVGEQPLFEGIIRSAMKSEQPDVELKKRTVPIFMDSLPLERALQIADKKQVWVGVISKTGLLAGAVTGPLESARMAKIDFLTESCVPSESTAAPTVSAAPDAVALQVISVNQVAQKRAEPETYIYDCNGAQLFAQGHIPGATLMAFDKVTAQVLPKNKSATLIFYCFNAQCGASPVAARAALALGYTNVFHMADGILGWKKAGLEIETPSK